MVCVQNIPSKRVSPGVSGACCFFDLYIHYNGLGITNPHTDVARGKGVRLFRGLTCIFWAENAENNCSGVQVQKNKGYAALRLALDARLNPALPKCNSNGKGFVG
jgi:hypothetical protein